MQCLLRISHKAYATFLNEKKLLDEMQSVFYIEIDDSKNCNAYIYNYFYY